MEGLQEVKRLKELAETQYLQNDTQSANIFILTSSIFLGALVVRHGWSIAAQYCVFLSVVNVMVGTILILVQRYQIKKVLDHTMSIDHAADVPEKLEGLLKDSSITYSLTKTRNLINNSIYLGYSIVIVNFILPIVTLAGK